MLLQEYNGIHIVITLIYFYIIIFTLIIFIYVEINKWK